MFTVSVHGFLVLLCMYGWPPFVMYVSLCMFVCMFCMLINVCVMCCVCPVAPCESHNIYVWCPVCDPAVP